MGGGGGLAGQGVLGNSERGGVALASLFSGLEWRLILAEEKRVFIPRSKRASQFGDSFRRLNLADSFRGSIWQVYSAGKFGKFIQWVNLASSFSRFLEKEKKSNRKEKKACTYSVDL